MNENIKAKKGRRSIRIGGLQEGIDLFYGAPVILVVLAGKAKPTNVYEE